jgi:hypothetical protein
MGREHVEVGHEEIAVVVVLEFYAVYEGAYEVPQVEPPCGPVSCDQNRFTLGHEFDTPSLLSG